MVSFITNYESGADEAFVEGNQARRAFANQIVADPSYGQYDERVRVEAEHKSVQPYDVYIGFRSLAKRLYSELKRLRPSKVIVISDCNTAPHVLPALCNAFNVEQVSLSETKLSETVSEVSLSPKHLLYLIKPGEDHKNTDTCVTLWKAFLDQKIDRHGLILNVGGGVVGDMGGFAAAAFKRGTRFIQIPTTLLAQVDASSGGKVGVDLSGNTVGTIKNVVGFFVSPESVIIDVETLKGLPERELRAGFAEIIKHGLVRDREYFDTTSDFIARHGPSLMQPGELQRLVAGSVKIKSDVVKLDPLEEGPRKLLNFGHTIGHALEAIALDQGRLDLNHGEAVALGMIAEASISVELGMLRHEDFEHIQRVITVAGFPAKIPFAISIDQVLEKILGDKKTFNSKTDWTLLDGIGDGRIEVHVEDQGVVRTALSLIASV